MVPAPPEACALLRVPRIMARQITVNQEGAMTAIGNDVAVGCWVIFLMYWAISARFVKPAQEVRWGVGRVRWMVMALIVLVVLVLRVSGWPGAIMSLLQVRSERPDSMTIIGLCLLVVGLIVAIFARQRLAGNWSAGSCSG